jgi:hypothetical protein
MTLLTPNIKKIPTIKAVEPLSQRIYPEVVLGMPRVNGHQRQAAKR